MSEIIDYLFSELDELKSQCEIVQGQLRKINSELQVIDEAVLKFLRKKKNLFDPFSSVNKEVKFTDTELQNLKQRQADLTKQASDKNTELRKYNLKIDKLNYLINSNNNSNVASNINNTSGNDACDDIADIDCISYRKSEQFNKNIAGYMNENVLQNICAALSKNKFISQLVNNDTQRAKFEIDFESDLLNKSINSLNDIIFILNPAFFKKLGYKYQIKKIIDIINSNSKTDILLNFQDSRNNNYSNSKYSNCNSEYSNKNKGNNGNDDNYDACNVSSVDNRRGIVSDDCVILSIRVIQELCNSVSKYSKCEKLYVNVAVDDKAISISEYNDGIDFDIDIIKNCISSISKENIKIKNNKNESIKLEVVIPLHKEKQNGNKCSISR